MLEVYALKKESLFQILKNEGGKFGAAVFILFLFLQIFYYKENTYNIIKILFGHLFLFILPGFIIMLYFRDKINFVYRLFIGIGLGFSLNILIVYYINIIIKINIGKFYIFVPIIIIILGFILIWKKEVSSRF